MFITLVLLKKKIIRKVIQRYFKIPSFCDEKWNLTIDIDENLGSYWRCLSGFDQKRWYAKEVFTRENIGI